MHLHYAYNSFIVLVISTQIFDHRNLFLFNFQCISIVKTLAMHFHYICKNCFFTNTWINSWLLTIAFSWFSMLNIDTVHHGFLKQIQNIKIAMIKTSIVNHLQYIIKENNFQCILLQTSFVKHSYTKTIYYCKEKMHILSTYIKSIYKA